MTDLLQLFLGFPLFLFPEGSIAGQLLVFPHPLFLVCGQSDQRHRLEKTIPCTPETSVIVISTQTWYRLRESLLEGGRATPWRN